MVMEAWGSTNDELRRKGKINGNPNMGSKDAMDAPNTQITQQPNKTLLPGMFDGIATTNKELGPTVSSPSAGRKGLENINPTGGSLPVSQGANPTFEGLFDTPISNVMNAGRGVTGMQPGQNTFEGLSGIAQNLGGSGGKGGGESSGRPFDYTQSPVYGAAKNQSELAFENARKNIMGSNASGGALDDLLAGAEMNKAGQLTDAAGMIGQDMFNKAFQTSMASPGTAMSGAASQGDLDLREGALDLGAQNQDFNQWLQGEQFNMDVNRYNDGQTNSFWNAVGQAGGKGGGGLLSLLM